MRVAVIYNFEACKLGNIGAALEEADIEIDIIHAHLGSALPVGPQTHDGMVVLGGIQNALADNKSPWMPALTELMREYVTVEKPLLGICLGSQLLARAYGGDNIIGGAEEFGWQQVDLTVEGANNPLFAGVLPSFPSFQWHDDTFTLPHGAIQLASSAAVENQAFSIGPKAFGLQFHFEACQLVVDQWSHDYAEFLTEYQPGWAERRHTEAERLGPASDTTGLTIARNWVGMIKPT